MQKHHKMVLVVTMPRPILLLLLSSSLLPPILAVDSPLPSPDGSDFIRTSCNTTLYPDLCFTSLSTFSNSIHNDSNHLARIAISLTLSNTLHLLSYLQNAYGNVPHNRTASVLKDCFENLNDAVDEMSHSMKELVATGSVHSFRFRMSNVKTWLSSALTYQYTCTDGFEDFHEDGSIKDDVCWRVDDAKKLTSIALALVNRYADKAVP